MSTPTPDPDGWTPRQREVNRLRLAETPGPEPDGWNADERRYTLMRLAFYRGLHGLATPYPRKGDAA